MKWNVFYYDINKRKIIPFNIFNHGSFNKDVRKLLSEPGDKGSFEKQLRSITMYYYWCKAEYEILISPWCGQASETIKVDIYTQIENNWERFLAYMWSQAGNNT